jgi:hypothetical protein
MRGSKKRESTRWVHVPIREEAFRRSLNRQLDFSIEKRLKLRASLSKPRCEKRELLKRVCELIREEAFHRNRNLPLLFSSEKRMESMVFVLRRSWKT